MAHFSPANSPVEYTLLKMSVFKIVSFEAAWMVESSHALSLVQNMRQAMNANDLFMVQEHWTVLSSQYIWLLVISVTALVDQYKFGYSINHIIMQPELSICPTFLDPYMYVLTLSCKIGTDKTDRHPAWLLWVKAVCPNWSSANCVAMELVC